MEFLTSFVGEPLQLLAERTRAFLPQLIMALVILLIGLVAGWLTKLMLRRILRVLRLDSHAERGGLSDLLSRGGVREPPSALLAKIAGSLVVAAFFLIALSSLNLAVLDQLIVRVFNLLPNVFFAVIIVMVGCMLGNFFGRAALIASVNAGVHFSGFAARFVRYLIIGLGTLIALEQLGIGKETVQLAFAILFSGMVLALALAFGLGGRDLAREYLERKLKGSPAGDDIQHL
jgi:hypothetical protein